MKNKLNSNNLISTYYENGLYELEFYVDDKEVIITNIKADEHPNAWTDEWYFDNNNVIEEILRNADDKDIEIEKGD